MLAVVPAIAVGLYMTDAIGLKDKFADILYENLGQTQLVETLVSAAEKNSLHRRERPVWFYLDGVVYLDFTVADVHRAAGFQQCMAGRKGEEYS